MILKKIVSKQIYDLELAHFAAAEVKNFKDAMKTKTRWLSSQGHVFWQTRHREWPYLLEKLPVAASSLDDLWSFPLEMRMRELAIHKGDLDRHPGENH